MIVQHVTRERLGRGLHHPLKYADIEACVDAAGASRIFLSVRFVGQPSSGQPDHRDRPVGAEGREYRELVRLHYHPEAHRVPVEGEAPWADVDNPVVLFADVWPVERELTQWLPRLRSYLAKLVAANVNALTPDGLPTSRWLLHCALLPETSEVEVGTTTWTELRRNDEAITISAVP